MQITVGSKALSGTIPAESFQKFKFSSAVALQTVKPLFSDSATPIDRGNKVVVFTFTIQRAHDTAEDAALFAMQEEAAYPVDGKCTYQTDAGEIYYPAAVAHCLDGDFTGATTTHSYRVTCGAAQTSGAGGGGSAPPIVPEGLS